MTTETSKLKQRLMRTVMVVGLFSVGVMVHCSDSESGVAIQPDPASQAGQAGTAGTQGISGAAGANGAGTAGSQAGTAGTGVVAGTGGAAGQVAQPKCADGLPGPKLVQVKGAQGTPYCIDATEVTKSQYQLFIKEAEGDKSWNKEPACVNNEQYAPAIIDNPEFTNGCTTQANDPEMYPNHPVVCVDWCDAAAYCAWAGKRLCGTMGTGKAIELTKAPDGQLDTTPLVDIVRDEWFNACSAEGQDQEMLGHDTQGKCNVPIDLENPTRGLNEVDAGACHSSVAPYSGLSWMVGNVWEWENCSNDGRYVIRGGGLQLGSQGSCQTFGGATFDSSPEVGFRCCSDVK